jgi:TIR domain
VCLRGAAPTKRLFSAASANKAIAALGSDCWAGEATPDAFACKQNPRTTGRALVASVVSGERMNDTLPYLFFFSYSRADWEYDAYLRQFFEDLKKRVAMLKGAGTREVGFRDEEGVKTGDDWTRKISEAVQKSHVLVCVYTPNFFSAERTHEFCAKEFMAFLKRDPNHRYERVVDEGDRLRYEVRDAHNILPILWFSEHDLVDLNKLPPYAVRTIQYTLNFASRAVNKEYREKGMSQITTRRAGTYWQILTHLARRVVELAANPLPPIEPAPDARTLRNAFWDPPEIAAADGAAPARGDGDARALDDDAAPGLGPNHLVAFEVRSAPGDALAWAPYPGEPCLRVLVEEIAQSRRRTSRYRTFDPSGGDFTALLDALRDATEKRVLPILLIDPKVLARPEWRAAVVSLLRHQWRGGIVVPVDQSDQPSIRLMENIEADFGMTPNEREWIVVRVTKRGVAEFRTAMISVADDILARIVKRGSVVRSTPATVGPSAPPRIANAQRAQP